LTVWLLAARTIFGVAKQQMNRMFSLATQRRDKEKETRMTKLYVGNLSFGMTDEALQQLFVTKGYQVASARVITDRETGRSRGFGFVELGAADDAAKAIGEFNGMDIEGRALQVNEARPQESRGGGDRSGSRGGYSGGRSGGRDGRRSY
jgi:RNA recognition motif-containing protein